MRRIQSVDEHHIPDIEWLLFDILPSCRATSQATSVRVTAAHRSKLPLAGEEENIESWGIEVFIHDRLDKRDIVVLLIT